MKKLTTVVVTLMLVLSGCTTTQTTNKTTEMTGSTDTITQTLEPITPYVDWTEDATIITLNNDEINVEGSGAVTQQEADIYIRTSGTYIFSGDYTAGAIIVDQEDDGVVRLILNDASIETNQPAAIQIEQADETILSVAPETDNTLISTATTKDDELTAVLFSRDDLIINGSGYLTIETSSNDGITSRDDLLITEVTLDVTAPDDGIVGRDMTYITNSILTVQSGGDGIKTTNEEDNKGDITILSTDMTIESESDAIQSIASLYVEEGNYTLTSGGGAPETIVETNNPMMGNVGGPLDITTFVEQLIEANDFDEALTEALREAESMDDLRKILEENGETLTAMPGDRGERPERGEGENGQMTPPDGMQGENGQMAPPDGMQGENGQMAPPDGMQGEDGQMTPPNEMEGDTTDDETMDETSDDTPSTKGLKAENTLVIASGTFTINSLDDAIHSNNEIQIDGGTIVLSSGDDGIHGDNILTINGGDLTVEKSYEGIEANIVTIHDGSLNITSTDDGMNAGTGASSGETGYLAIHGGDITIDASGDGIDSNTTIQMTGGTVIINGTETGPDGAIDYDETFNMSGGILVAAGSSEMAQSPSDSSSQSSIVYQFDQSTTESIALTDDSGQFILGFTPTKSYQTIVVSSPLLETDKTFTCHTAVDVDGEAVNGLVTDGVITASTELDFTLTDTLTYLTASGVSSTPLTESGFGGRPNRSPQ